MDKKTEKALLLLFWMMNSHSHPFDEGCSSTSSFVDIGTNAYYEFKELMKKKV